MERETYSEPGNEIVSVLSLLKTSEGHLGSRDVPERRKKKERKSQLQLEREFPTRRANELDVRKRVGEGDRSSSRRPEGSSEV